MKIKASIQAFDENGLRILRANEDHISHITDIMKDKKADEIQLSLSLRSDYDCELAIEFLQNAKASFQKSTEQELPKSN